MSIITILWVLIGFMALIIVVGVSIGVYLWLTYRYKIELYKAVGNNKFLRTNTYRARKVKMKGRSQDFKLWIPKAKMMISPYGKLISRNTYMYCEGPDGLWYNSELGDVDAKMGVLDIEVLERDVREQYISNEENARVRYENKPKNWPMVFLGITVIISLLIVAVGGYYHYKQINEGSSTSQANIKASLEATKAAASVVTAVERLLEGGQGPGIVQQLNNNSGGG